jgi:hypothetical protein
LKQLGEELKEGKYEKVQDSIDRENSLEEGFAKLEVLLTAKRLTLEASNTNVYLVIIAILGRSF